MIREVTPKDIGSLQLIWHERSKHSVKELVHRAMWLAKRKRGRGLIITREETVIGFGMITFWRTSSEISDLFVKHQFRNHGYGTDLIHHLISISIEYKFSTIEIGVLKSNQAALRLYERLGFEVDRVLQRENRSSREDIIYLRKYFEEE